MSANKNEEILNKMCDDIVHSIDAMILSAPHEQHHDADVKIKAKKICRKARKRVKEYLVEMIKYASDPDFVLKDIPDITDEDDFKFLQIKED